jgi:DNA-binding NtrC family response regulator
MVSSELLLAEFDAADPAENPLPEAIGLVADDLEQTKQSARKHLQNAGRLKLDATLELWERGYIEAAIELSAGNMSQAARRLGINRTTLYNRLEGWSRR